MILASLYSIFKENCPQLTAMYLPHLTVIYTSFICNKWKNRNKKTMESLGLKKHKTINPCLPQP